MENYKFIEKLGRGTHGTVYLLRATDTNRYVVCKSIMDKYMDHAQREIDILSRLCHRRIVRLIDSVHVSSSVFIILEYANCGTLERMIQYFSRSGARPGLGMAWSVLSQVSDALHYLHSKKIVHRDIKPANILVSKFWARGAEYLEFKLCDFSLSTGVEALKEGAAVGTPFYMAPEVVARKAYGPSIDVWGLGVVVYETLNLKKPFSGGNRRELYRSILTREIPPSEISGDESLSRLVGMCLEKGERASARAIARNERVRLNLVMLELRHRESRIEVLEGKIREWNKIE